MDALADGFARVQMWLFEGVVQPLVFNLGWMRWQEEAFDATEWLLAGVVEVALLAVVLGLLQRWMPAEPVVDRASVRTDILYTLLHRLGAFSLLVFALVTPLMDGIEGHLRLLGISRLNVDQIWPGVTDRPLVSFAIYLVIFDFVDYWVHRGQHQLEWWWQLHALHHSQRQMTFWTDDRNHLLDDLLHDGLFAVLAVFIGVGAGQFMSLIIAVRVIESLQHANLRWRFGAIGERLLVSPSFHRRHHAIGDGHEGRHRGCNFAVLFPVWDVLFGTADFRPGFVPTGIRDQLSGRDYGRGFWRQNWLGLRRLFGVDARPPDREAG
ncbi:MAG: sterol desaturase family protein [Burkholderiaceae bacterium]